jgi:hypothetical protein
VRYKLIVGRDGVFTSTTGLDTPDLLGSESRAPIKRDEPVYGCKSHGPIINKSVLLRLCDWIATHSAETDDILTLRVHRSDRRLRLLRPARPSRRPGASVLSSDYYGIIHTLEFL